MKRKLFYMLMIAAAMAGCRQSATSDGRCRIEGTVAGEQYEGKRIFLVPLNGPATAETVDSMEITGGRFHFEPDTMQMYKILIDYHYRVGLQPLIVVGEPGLVTVSIDSVSHATGTLQNDSLELWKQRTEMHNHRMGLMRKEMASLRMKGLAQEADLLKQRSDSIHLAYKKMTRRMAANLKEGTLHDFLESLYPLTYKRKMPDGRIVTMNADTNEEISE